MEEQTKQTSPSIASSMSSRKLASAVFKAELPEVFVKQIPAQSLFLAIKQNGLASSAEIIEIASVEQVRLMIDFDCWKKDRFNEDNFWEWLSATDVNNDLGILLKIIKSVDLKLFSILISKYVNSETFTEPTDLPPSPEHYTPDRGNTWINVVTEDNDRDFLMKRALAAIFEMDADLFYQLLAIPSTATLSQLEESSFEEKGKRIAAEGVPDYEYAFSMNTPLNSESLKNILSKEEFAYSITEIPSVPALVYDSESVQPLERVLAGLKNLEDVESEFTLLMNAAVVHWIDDFGDHDELLKLSEQVKGAVNIGLLQAEEISSLATEDIFIRAGSRNLYRFGLNELKKLQHKAQEHQDETDPAILAILEGIKKPFPEVPSFISTKGEMITEDGKLPGGYEAFTTLKQILQVKKIICGHG